MTEQEKKIIDLIEVMDYEVHESGQVNLDSHTTAKAIIEAFPQITKKPVVIECFHDTGESHLVCDYEIANNLEKYQSEYFVEVVE